MGIGASVCLIAIGAILAFAVRQATLGGWLDINTAGWVLMIAGGIGLVASLIIWSSHRRTTVERPVDPRERHIIEEDRY